MADSPMTLPDDKTRDPVCGTEAADSDITLDHDGETYHFCSQICRRQFERDPDIYLDRPAVSEASYHRAKRDFLIGLVVALLANIVGMMALTTYLSIVFGQGQMGSVFRIDLTITGLSFLSGILIALWLIKPLLRCFVSGDKSDIRPDNQDSIRRTALNFPVFMAFIIFGNWFIFGSIGAYGMYLSGLANYLDWFLHILLGTLYTGLITGIGVFYITESLFAWNVYPFLMQGDDVSSLDGVIPVPTWFRITFLVLTTAVFPMLHLLGLHYLGDATTRVLVYFIAGIVAVAVLQGIYILRSISAPIGQIASEFERFQTGRPLKRNISIYRADDLGRFAEMFDDLMRSIHERDFLQRTFGRYMSQEVLEEILDGDVELGGKRQRATVLFADIRNFTGLTEEMEPEDVVKLLNEYFDLMVEGITEHEGIPDKFLGDGLLAVWGIPMSGENRESRAVQGGLSMLKNLETFNETQTNIGDPTLEIGIGIHTGELIAGNIGSKKKMEYTVIGDTVNTCSRLESLNKELDSVMTISGKVYEKLAPVTQQLFEATSTVKPRGKTEEIELYVLQDYPVERN
ncbi:MAG: adenylate/guanylate cyclase domain-containing protein [bacterium]